MSCDLPVPQFPPQWRKYNDSIYGAAGKTESGDPNRALNNAQHTIILCFSREIAIILSAREQSLPVLTMREGKGY